MQFEKFNNDHPSYKILSNLYEEEFASITGAVADVNGNYEVSTPIDDAHLGYFVVDAENPVGFMIVNMEEKPFDVCEMFIKKEYRNCHFASELIKYVFNLHKGKWQVKQLYDASQARSFWLGFLKNHTEFAEEIYQDKKWGKVYRQIFEVK